LSRGESLDENGLIRLATSKDAAKMKIAMLERKKLNGKTAGVAGIYKKYSLPFFFLAVAHEHRGRGIGKELAGTLLKKAAAKYRYIVLSTDNPVAERIYRPLGFEETFRKKGRVGMVYWSNANALDRLFIRVASTLWRLLP